MSASETNILRILFLLSVVSIVCVYNVTGAVVENVEDIRISRYYEKCKSSDDCFDYRLICKTQADNETRCVCDMFHMWNDQFNVCVQRYNSTHMVSLLIEKYDHASLIEKEAKLIYFGAVVAGFVVLSVGFACVVAIICYCHHMRIRDNQLKDIIGSYKKAKENVEKKNKNKIDGKKVEEQAGTSDSGTLRRDNVKINIMRIEQQQQDQHQQEEQQQEQQQQEKQQQQE